MAATTVKKDKELADDKEGYPPNAAGVITPFGIYLTLGSFMHQSHPDINTPPDDTVLWRYLSMEKLLALCNSKELYLTRADKFTDPWEGTWPKTFLEVLSQNAKNDTVDKFFPTITALKQSFYVNCWHGSPHESAALWEQYSGKAGFAIKTTIGSLKEAITTEIPIYLGAVSYTDYGVDPKQHGSLNVLKPLFMKRKSFEHEREVRLLHWHPSNVESVRSGNPEEILNSVGVKVNLDILLHELYVSPTSPAWLIEHISKLLEVFGIQDIPVLRSTLYDPYVY